MNRKSIIKANGGNIYNLIRDIICFTLLLAFLAWIISNQHDSAPKIALLISGSSTLACILFYRNFSENMKSHCGLSMFYLIGFSTLFYNAVPFLWLLAALPPINPNLSKEFLGISGSYGTDIKTYPIVSSIFAYMTWGPLLFSFLLGKKKIMRSKGPSALAKIKQNSWMNQLAIGGMIATVVLVAFYFASRGFSLLGSTDMSRTEIWDTDHIGLMSRFKIIRYLPCVVALLSISIGLLNRKYVLATLTLVVAVLPYIAEASRVTSLLIISFSACCIWFAPKLYKLPVAVIVFPICLIANAMPLVTRSSSTFSLGVMGSLYSLNATNSKEVYKTEIIRSLSGIGQGYGNVAEYISRGRTFYTGNTDISKKYMLISLSPAPSFIDGFSGKWRNYQSNFHIGNHTPISSISEIYLWGGYWGIFFYPFLLFFFMYSTRLVENLKTSQWQQLLIFLSVIFVVFGIIRSGAYDIRSSSRYLYASYYLVIAIAACRLFIPPKENHSKIRKKQPRS